MLSLILPLIFLVPQDDPTQKTVAKAATTTSAISADDLRLHIGYLASDELEGRGSGDAGEKLAAAYFVSQWKRLGLKPGNGKKYTHEFEVRDRKDGKSIKLTCTNTCAILPGTNPRKKGQYLVIGGHHDHAGFGNPMTGGMGSFGEIHNGADDNASGSSGVIELAEYFAAHPLEHPILFLSFSAEERGLLGSKAFVKDKIINPKKMLAMLNLDMIGRMEDNFLFVGGMGTAKEFHSLLDPVLTGGEIKATMDDRGEAPSDNTSFYHAGVPALFFFTHIHEDYHMPTDDADGIHYEDEARILELVRDVAVVLDQSKKLTFKKNPGMGMPDDFMERMSNHYVRAMERKNNMGKLGLTPKEGKNKITVKKIRKDSPAEKAGLRQGDLIISINGYGIDSIFGMRRALAGKMKGESVEVVYQRSKETHSTTAILE